MMDMKQRKAALAHYKERKIASGIYAVRCSESGQCWVGHAPDLSTIRNRIWFTLRQGCNSHASLQDAWRRHGPAAFALETVETFADEDLAFVRDRRSKDRLDHWVDALQAIRI